MSIWYKKLHLTQFSSGLYILIHQVSSYISGFTVWTFTGFLPDSIFLAMPNCSFQTPPRNISVCRYIKSPGVFTHYHELELENFIKSLVSIFVYLVKWSSKRVPLTVFRFAIACIVFDMLSRFFRVYNLFLFWLIKISLAFSTYSPRDSVHLQNLFLPDLLHLQQYQRYKIFYSVVMCGKWY